MQAGSFVRIDTVFLPVTDLDQAIEWFSQALGLALRWREGGYAALGVGETVLTLYEVKEVSPSGHQLLNFYTPDIEAAHRRLSAHSGGVSAIHEHPGIRYFEFTDPDGNLLGVCWFPEEE